LIVLKVHLFYFSYDFVDQIVLLNPSPEIKGIKVDLEKTWTGARID
jgi:hypothetical protein